MFTFAHVEGGFSRVVGNVKENVCSRVCGGGFFRLVRSRGKCLLLRMEGRVLQRWGALV